jgi:TolA-binding protein
LLNQLETRIERLELDSAERQVSVLNAIEKTMTQLRAREAKREREKASQDDAGATNGDEQVPQHPPARASSAHLAKRFRGF